MVVRTFDPLEGLDRALGVQGGMQGPDMVRSDAGIYLYHEIGDYIARRQTYQRSENVTVDTAGGAAGYQVDSPGTTGMRFGRYLVSCWVSTTNAANLTGWCVALNNAGVVEGYPSVSLCPIMVGGSTVRNVFTAGILGTFVTPDPSPVTLPLWCPPGSFIRLMLLTSAASGIYTLRTLWHTTEALDQAGTSPIGRPGASPKV